MVFADGTFIDGSTLELSADGPLREPYAVYVQGGTHWTHWAIVLREALREMAEVGGIGLDGGAGARIDGGASGEDAKRYAGRRSLKNAQ